MARGGGCSDDLLDLTAVERVALDVYDTDEETAPSAAGDGPDCYIFFGEVADAVEWSRQFDQRLREPGFFWKTYIKYELKDDWNVWLYMNGSSIEEVVRDVLDTTFAMKLPLFREHSMNEHWWARL